MLSFDGCVMYTDPPKRLCGFVGQSIVPFVADMGESTRGGFVRVQEALLSKGGLAAVLVPLSPT